jgi:signal transduction histidine kinase
VEKVLRSIIEGVSNNYGKQFFQMITLKMHEAIGADFTFIARLDTEAYVSRTIALVAGGEVVDNMEYSLEHTPCANVADNSICLYPNQITSLFPKDQLLIDMGIEGYIGTPLLDSHGQVMGLTVALYKKAITNPEFTETIFQIFSGRISAEIERMEHEHELEQKVAERTLHLEQALKNLKQTQAQLVEQEKLASLGGVVAGVAHEINTPLGITKTAHTLHESLLQKLASSFHEKSLTSSAMEDYIKRTQEIEGTITQNLERAIDLIQNFKHAAVDRVDGNIHTHNLKQLIERLTASMSAEFSRNNIQCDVDIAEDIEISTYGSDLSQVISNLLMNACVHAFNGIDKKQISIAAVANTQGIQLSISDNGVGVDESIRDKVFDPFVTTKRHAGSTGLGMNIVFNQVTNSLQGSIQLECPKQGGTLWNIQLPLSLTSTTK